MSKSIIGLLGKLGPKSVNLAGVGGGGKAEITASDVAAALAQNYGLSRGAQALGLYLIDRHGSEQELIFQVALEIDRANTDGQHIGPMILNGLARSIVLEFCHLELCRRCDGAGKVFRPQDPPDITTLADEGTRPVRVVTRVYVTCPACEGGGVCEWSDYRRAKEAGLNDRTYVRRYRSLRDHGYQAICSWLTDLKDHLTEQFDRDELTSH